MTTVPGRSLEGSIICSLLDTSPVFLSLHLFFGVRNCSLCPTLSGRDVISLVDLAFPYSREGGPRVCRVALGACDLLVLPMHI